MFNLVKVREIEKEFNNHDISARDTYGMFAPLVSGFSFGIKCKRADIISPLVTNTAYYRVFDRSNPDDFYALTQKAVDSFVTINILRNKVNNKHKAECRISPSLLMTLDETVDKRIKTCYDVLKAKQT